MLNGKKKNASAVVATARNHVESCVAKPVPKFLVQDIKKVDEHLTSTETD